MPKARLLAALTLALTFFLETGFLLTRVYFCEGCHCTSWNGRVLLISLRFLRLTIFRAVSQQLINNQTWPPF